MDVIARTQSNRQFLAGRQIGLLMYGDHNREPFIRFLAYMRDDSGKTLGHLLHTTLNHGAIVNVLHRMLQDFELSQASKYKRNGWEAKQVISDISNDFEVPARWLKKSARTKAVGELTHEDIELPIPETPRQVSEYMALLFSRVMPWSDMVKSSSSNQVCVPRTSCLAMRFTYQQTRYVVCDAYSRLDYRAIESMLCESNANCTQTFVSSLLSINRINPSLTPEEWRVHHSVLLAGYGYLLPRDDDPIHAEWLNGEWDVQDNGLMSVSNWQELLYCMYLDGSSSHEHLIAALR